MNEKDVAINKIMRQMSDFAFEIIKEVDSKPNVSEEKRKFYEEKSRWFNEMKRRRLK
jgi:hypothetical protein